MPQLDKTIILTNIITTIVIFTAFYMVTMRYLMPKIFLKIYLRKKYLNYIQHLREDLHKYMSYRRKLFNKLYTNHLNLYLKLIRKEKYLMHKLTKIMFKHIIKKHKIDVMFTRIELHIFAYFKTLLYHIKMFNNSDIIKKGILKKKILDEYFKEVDEDMQKLNLKNLEIRKDVLEKFKITKLHEKKKQ